MSYIVAYVQFEENESSLDYPVNCLRTDVKAGDVVVIRMQSQGGKLTAAKVTKVDYLNWNCANTIECLASEAALGSRGIELPLGCPILCGLARPGDACAYLEKTGWTPRRPNNKQFKIAYNYANASQTALIFFRDNGVDIQILDGRGTHPPTRYSRVGFAPSAGIHVRHFLAQSGVNLFEHTLKFAEAFQSNRMNYSEFFHSVGSNEKVTDELRTRLFLRSSADSSFDAMLYDLLGGDGGDAYVGDGLSLSSSGRWIDD